MSWSTLGENFPALIEHLEKNQLQSQTLVDTLTALAQAQQLYSGTLLELAETHEKQYYG